MAKTKKQTKKNLIRSDKNLLAFGLFGAALLIGVFLFFDFKPAKVMNQTEERTYRVETAPAAMSSEETRMTTPENQGDANPDY